MNPPYNYSEGGKPYRKIHFGEMAKTLLRFCRRRFFTGFENSNKKHPKRLPNSQSKKVETKV